MQDAAPERYRAGPLPRWNGIASHETPNRPVSLPRMTRDSFIDASLAAVASIPISQLGPAKTATCTVARAT